MSKLDLVDGWSCDERNRTACRNPHGCHCREITALRIATKPQEVQVLDFFSQSVDAWGALEWFDRLAKAVREQDKAVVAGDTMTMETCRNVASSSAMRLVRDYEPLVRAALSLSRPAPQSMPESGLTARGVGRMFDNEKAVLVIFDRKLTDDELRALHDQIRILP